MSARGTHLPQIWMTYEELAEMLDCSVAAAREFARAEQLDRKISRDGNKRAKLNANLVVIFIARIKTMDLAIDQAVEELRHVHGLLEQADGPRRLASWLGLRKAG
jgi:predicted transcriptional regulator